MSKWKNIKIGEFLTAREGKYKPDDIRLKGLMRLDKIDFLGNIHLSDKPTKTDMIIIYPNDLVISGINVAKGAVAVYKGKKPIVATIHYSSYQFDEEKIDISFFKLFLKSPNFVAALNEQVKGGIKTEIKPKSFLPIVLQLPSHPEQIEIYDTLSHLQDNLTLINKENNYQGKYLKDLRQSILQDAIEGKLTAEWRNQNPVIKGDPNTDAHALLERIKAEKKRIVHNGKFQKRKKFDFYALPELKKLLVPSWELCPLIDIIECSPRNGYSPRESHIPTTKTLKLGATTSGYFKATEFKYINEHIPDDSFLWLKKNDILIQRANSLEHVGVSAIYEEENEKFIYPDLMMKVRVVEPINVRFIHLVLSSKLIRTYYRNSAKGAQKNMPKINQEVVSLTPIFLPSLEEQNIIVKRVDYLIDSINLLEVQLNKRKEFSSKLMQSVLKEAFTPT